MPLFFHFFSSANFCSPGGGQYAISPYYGRTYAYISLHTGSVYMTSYHTARILYAINDVMYIISTLSVRPLYVLCSVQHAPHQVTMCYIIPNGPPNGSQSTPILPRILTHYAYYLEAVCIIFPSFLPPDFWPYLFYSYIELQYICIYKFIFLFIALLDI